MHFFAPRKGAEVPDLNALELGKTWVKMEIPYKIDVSRSK
jgi:hypothetical protein